VIEKTNKQIDAKNQFLQRIRKAIDSGDIKEANWLLGLYVMKQTGRVFMEMLEVALLGFPNG